MDKEKLHNIGCWIEAVFCIALVIGAYLYVTNKENQERLEEERAKTEQLLHDKFIYKDVNGVFHIKHDCRMLMRYHYTSDDEKEFDIYSSSYVSRDSISNWQDFAATHQLCSKCFTPKLIWQLDSVLFEKEYPYIPGEGRLSRGLKKQHKGTDSNKRAISGKDSSNSISPRDIIR